jgi:hypothetical protein
MAKMFYSLDEAAQRLGKSAGEVQAMVASGQLQEFRGGDNKLMFKREQVDLLAGDAKGDSGMRLADSSGNSGIGLSLEDSAGGSGAIELDEPAPVPARTGGGGAPSTGSGKGANDRSGISIFDTESTEEGDPSAVTRITETAGAGELTLDSVGSGSGLLDLTRESDDTSLGADLLEDVYKGDDQAETQGASGLFENTAAPSDVGAAAVAPGAMGMIAAEPYEPAWSGIGGGLALGATVVMALALVSAIMGLMGAENPLAAMVGASMFMWLGIFAAAILVLAIVGWLLGKRAA